MWLARGDAKPGRVADRQNRATLDIPHTTQKLQNFPFSPARRRAIPMLLGSVGVGMTSVRLLCSQYSEAKTSFLRILACCR